jgi:hypothetical protein
VKSGDPNGRHSVRRREQAFLSAKEDAFERRFSGIAG